MPAVYLQALTVRARRAIALDVIPDGRPPESDCFAQDVFDGTVQAPNLFVRQRTGRAIRSDTGAKKCLVGVNVPESRDALLVEQGTFHTALSPQRPAQRPWRESVRERLRP